MPFYEYRCDNGHTFEVMQRMSDDWLTNCLTCEAEVQRVFHPVAVHFKGSGFYSTDYGKRGAESSEDGKPEDAKKEDAKKDEAKKDDAKKDEAKKDEAKKESAASSTERPGSSANAGSGNQGGGGSGSST